MKTLQTLYFLSLAAAVTGSMAMALLLRLKSTTKEVGLLLALFCTGVAFWLSGYLLLACRATGLQEAGRFLINLSPLVAAFFLHFVFVFTGKKKQTAVIALYFIAFAASATGIVLSAGEIRPWLGFDFYYRANSGTALLAAVTLLYSVLGHLFLLKESVHVDKKRQRQMLALFISGFWGLLSASGFVFEAMDIDIFPYPVLLLPGYTVLLTYGILRYELMEINIWARRTLTWVIILLAPLFLASIPLVLLAKLGLSGFSGTSFILLWLIIMSTISLTTLLQKPAAALAEKIVYPGGRINPKIMTTWQQELEEASSREELALAAEKLLSQTLMYQLKVTVGNKGKEEGLSIYREGNNWKYCFIGLEEATPSLRYKANVLASLILSVAMRLENFLILAEKEKEMLKEQHLTDLGRLSASVAHELRNPLNIISMASANCPAEIKTEIKEQLNRSQKLIEDLLSYSGQLKIEPKSLDLKEEVDYVLSHYKNHNLAILVTIPEELTITFDSHRLHQVFFNLMDNACKALKWVDSPSISIRTKLTDQRANLTFADNGPGIGGELAKELFRPFVSGGAGGSGLGLAIVKRIMGAHGGTIELAQSKPGNCTFKLSFRVEK